ncbi:MAG: GNAT family N-acetyltransferase [Gammaproteobacteria bacterium]|nr:GNAT family N-acetyltransferase [Gammaproteobacteria bacterium]
MANTIIRPYDSEKDEKAVIRIWEETRWIDRGDENDAAHLRGMLGGSRALVGELDGDAECVTISSPASIRHLREDIPLGIVAAVTTSPRGRRAGFASRATAGLVQQDAEAGMMVSALGMFEQGFYTRLGFGNGPSELRWSFDPSNLGVDARAGIPVRITIEDSEDVHRAMCKRALRHGGVCIQSHAHVRADMGWTENPLGLGYRDAGGELTHFVWGEMKDENGPFVLVKIAWREPEQLRELLALLKGFGDQAHLVKMIEPAGLQLQDFIDRPLRENNTPKEGEWRKGAEAEAWWQARINDLAGCLQRTSLPQSGAALAFNLHLDDPIGRFLPSKGGWKGVGGDYVVELGAASSAVPGSRKGLPSLHAGIAGFTRLWLGCAEASAIAATGQIEASSRLLDDLETTLRMPIPRTGCEF